MAKNFKNKKKINDEKRYAFLNHIGEDPYSPYNNALKSCTDLINQSRHIDKVMHARCS